MNLQSVRTSVVDAVGPKAIHAVEDGLSVGLVLGLSFTLPSIAAALLTLLGAAPQRAGPVSILSELVTIVRQDDARAQESYFVISSIIGVCVGGPLGAALVPIVGSAPLPL